MPRQAAVNKAARSSAAIQDATNLGDLAEDSHDNEELHGEEDNMTEMIQMLQEFQSEAVTIGQRAHITRISERKASRASASSETFQRKKAALFAEARRNADCAVRDGIAHVEHFATKLADLRAQEISGAKIVADISIALETQEGSIRSLLAVYPPMFQNLSHCRAEEINEASAMLESHSVERHRSRRRLIKNAKVRLDEELENQRIATDASALIKHYKALLLP